MTADSFLIGVAHLSVRRFQWAIDFTVRKLRLLEGDNNARLKPATCGVLTPYMATNLCSMVTVKVPSKTYHPRRLNCILALCNLNASFSNIL